eukprot:gene3219-2201_t
MPVSQFGLGWCIINSFRVGFTMIITACGWVWLFCDKTSVLWSVVTPYIFCVHILLYYRFDDLQGCFLILLDWFALFT